MDILNSFDHLVARISMLTQNGEYRDALVVAIQLVDRHPGQPKAWSKRAHVYAQLEQWQQATHDIGIAIEIEPTAIEYWYKRGTYSFASGNEPAAIPDFGRVIEMSLKSGQTFFLNSAKLYLADACIRQRRYSEARRLCQQLPDDYQGWTDRLRTRDQLLLLTEGHQ
jgi:tetratricopeptide (TPR) repeat protein